MLNAFKTLPVLLTASLALTGCVLEEDSETSPYNINAQMGDVTNGVADITIKVSAKDGGELPESNIQVQPLMEMVSGMQHGTPFSSNSGALNDNGEFTTTAYFLMPSNMMDGTKMGDWSLNIEFNGQQVNQAISIDAFNAPKQLKGDHEDSIVNDMGHEPRTYYVFDMGRHVMMDMNSFSVYVAARESLFEYNAVSEGITLHGAEDDHHDLVISGVTVEMCNDNCDEENSWKTAMEDMDKPGIYKAMGLTLNNDDTDQVNVRLTVNNITKLTAGDMPMNHVTFTFDGMQSSHDDSMSHSSHP